MAIYDFWIENMKFEKNRIKVAEKPTKDLPCNKAF